MVKSATSASSRWKAAKLASRTSGILTGDASVDRGSDWKGLPQFCRTSFLDTVSGITLVAKCSTCDRVGGMQTSVTSLRTCECDTGGWRIRLRNENSLWSGAKAA